MHYSAQAFKQLLWLSARILPLTLAASVPVAIAQLPPASLAQAEPAPPQPSYPTCHPPSQGEYLLLIATKTSEDQDTVRRMLPANISSLACRYLNAVVMRVGGFTAVDAANAWARYVMDSAGLPTFVARPAQTATPTAAAPTPPVTPSPTAKPVLPTAPSQNPVAYTPRPLGKGYAVLVDFFSRPELAAQVQQQLGKEIGLVSYQQRPYLLAVHTADQGTANSILKALTDRGFWTMVVDSRRVTLLRQAVPIN